MEKLGISSLRGVPLKGHKLSDEAISILLKFRRQDCFASLAMTWEKFFNNLLMGRGGVPLFLTVHLTI